MGVILFIFSLVLSILFVPIGILVSIIHLLFSAKFKKALQYVNRLFLSMAVSIDQFGNVACGELFNLILTKQTSVHRFGNPDETISSVLGKNQQDLTLAFLGRGLNNILNWLDPNHSVKSIEE